MTIRTLAQHGVALLIGVIFALMVATLLNATAQSDRQSRLDARNIEIAAQLQTALNALADAAGAIGLSEGPPTAEKAEALFAAALDKTLIKLLGVASWRRTEDGPVIDRAFESAAVNSAFRGVVEAYHNGLDTAFDRASRTDAVRGLAARRPIAIEDPAAYDGESLWLVWRDPDEARLTVARIGLAPAPQSLALSDEISAEPRLFFGAEPIPMSRPTSLFSSDPPEARARPAVLWSRPAVALQLVASPAETTGAWLGRKGQAIFVGLLAALVIVAVLRVERQRTERTLEEHRTAMHSIALKQRELEDSEARFKRLAESTNVVPWTANLDTQRFTYVGPQVEDFTGYPATTWYANGFWTHHIHPDDRRRVLVDEISKIPPGTYHTIEYRIRAANGRILHLRNMLTVSRKKAPEGERPSTIAQGFLLDVTDMKRAEATLEEARRKAEEANRVKSEFLANMSHELRTPLNAVIGFSEIMKEEVFGPIDTRYREYADSIHASGRHLLDLINDVLDLSKIEAGRIELAETETDLREILGTCVSLLKERIASAGLRCSLRVEDRLPTVLADERRLKQVVLNLVSNAVKFTPPGGAILVWASRAADGGISLAVRDTGVGMSPDEIPRALSKFGQIDGELARKHDGTGLGLPIAKSLIELHKGKLFIESERGKGTEVRLWLPEERIIVDAA